MTNTQFHNFKQRVYKLVHDPIFSKPIEKKPTIKKWVNLKFLGLIEIYNN